MDTRKSRGRGSKSRRRGSKRKAPRPSRDGAPLRGRGAGNGPRPPRDRARATADGIARRNLLLLKILRALTLGIPVVAVFFFPAAPAALGDLTELSLEDLMEIEVTTVSKKSEQLSSAPAAVYVMSGEEVRRTGGTTIAEALRYVPGVQVSRVSSNWWAVTVRGFAGNFANKLLVLVDGRSVYTPFYAGTYWDAQNILLEDIDRIEVIRGPGATLWGANAVNGVINIITKDARETEGLFVHAGAGTREAGLGSFRYGAAISPSASLRLYGNYTDRKALHDVSGRSGEDDWTTSLGGLRFDWAPTPARQLTALGEWTGMGAGALFGIPTLSAPDNEAVRDTTHSRGGFGLLRWIEAPSATSELSLQTYVDWSEREDIQIDEGHLAVDVELQHRWKPRKRAELVWGAGYRSIADDVDPTMAGFVIPARRTVDVFSGFGQAEFLLRDEAVHLTIGSKFERNDYTGFEVQPSARLQVLPRPGHALWGSVARAVRTPSRIEQDAVLTWASIPPSAGENPLPYPGLVTLYGTDGFASEVLTAYETGYRFTRGDDLALDLAIFYNRYTELRTGEAGNLVFHEDDEGSVAWFVLPFRGTNQGEGQSYGAELAVDWRASDRILFRSGYSALQLDVWMADGSDAIEIEAAEGASPEHQGFLQCFLDLPHRLGADVGARYVGDLPGLDIESYVTLDARVGWRPIEPVEIFAVGTNLIEPEHTEFPPQLQSGLFEIERGVYGGVSVRY
ncbi:MAG: TonB-dependent receptor [Candidatus Latescibacterota bacterium]|nr:MAG: TonB-dependent receptor [Candidatus Latescibacterota bacterium]